MVDDAMYDRYNKGAEKSLRPLSEPNATRADISTGTMLDTVDPDFLDTPYIPAHIRAYGQIAQATRRRMASMHTQIRRKYALQSRYGSHLL